MLLVCALLEAGGDALARKGMHARTIPIRAAQTGRGQMAQDMAVADSLARHVIGPGNPVPIARPSTFVNSPPTCRPEKT